MSLTISRTIANGSRWQSRVHSPSQVWINVFTFSISRDILNTRCQIWIPAGQDLWSRQMKLGDYESLQIPSMCVDALCHEKRIGNISASHGRHTIFSRTEDSLRILRCCQKAFDERSRSLVALAMSTDHGSRYRDLLQVQDKVSLPKRLIRSVALYDKHDWNYQRCQQQSYASIRAPRLRSSRTRFWPLRRVSRISRPS